MHAGKDDDNVLMAWSAGRPVAVFQPRLCSRLARDGARRADASLTVVTRARNRAVAQAVAARWTYTRIGGATGLSNSRIGQVAPARAGRDPEAEPSPLDFSSDCGQAYCVCGRRGPAAELDGR